MTLTQITTFCCVVENMSISKTAERLCISQPAISRQIAQLEEEFGFPLFDRTRRGISLTSAGMVVYNFFLHATVEYKITLEEARMTTSENENTIRLGCLDGWDLSCFYTQLKSFFAEKSPKLKITLEAYSFVEMIPALRHGEVDVVISRGTHLRDYTDISIRQLTTTGGVLLFSPNHPNADKPNLKMEDFKTDAFFSVNEPEGLRNTSRFTREQCNLRGFNPVIIKAPSLAATFMKVQNCEGVFFVDDWIMIKSSPLFRHIPVHTTFDIGVGWLDDNRNAAKALFINDLLFYYKQINEASIQDEDNVGDTDVS